MSKVQGRDERGQGPHLPPAAKVEMPEMHHGQDAEAKGQVPLLINVDFSLRRAATAIGPALHRRRSVAYR